MLFMMNRILVNGEPKYFNVPMLGASPYKLINEVGVNNDRKLTDKNLRALEGAYRKAPYYGDVFPLMERVLESGKDDIASYIAESFRIIGEYLDIKTEFIISSDLEKDCEQKGQDKVLSICKLLGATEYYNAIGGQELYSFEDFKAQDITLKFLKTSDIVYEQFGNEFQPNLSIVDVMMFNSREQVQQMLNEYTLITE